MKNPKKYKIADIQQYLRFPIDVFICSSSYETRCKTIPDQLNMGIRKVLICENQDLKEIIAPNTSYLLDKFGRRAETIHLETNDPIKGADILRNALTNTITAETKKILIDITTFTHESLLILFKLLQQFSQRREIKCVYTNAADYSVGLSQEDKWLSKGIGEIRSVLGYPGVLLPSRKTHLIVLVGFEKERAEKLIEAYEPAVLSLGFAEASESVYQAHHKTNKYFHFSLSQRYSNVREFTFSCINPCKTKLAILDQAKLVSNHNIIVAAMNTKISTIGAALAAFENESIQLCYAHANQYNYENYSVPGAECFLFNLSLTAPC